MRLPGRPVRSLRAHRSPHPAPTYDNIHGGAYINATTGPFQQAELVRRVADQLAFGGTGILVVDTLVELGGSGATPDQQAKFVGAVPSLASAS
jgi:hypothetical protein